jgi:hypothetical protein
MTPLIRSYVSSSPQLLARDRLIEPSGTARMSSSCSGRSCTRIATRSTALRSVLRGVWDTACGRRGHLAASAGLTFDDCSKRASADGVRGSSRVVSEDSIMMFATQNCDQWKHRYKILARLQNRLCGNTSGESYLIMLAASDLLLHHSRCMISAVSHTSTPFTSRLCWSCYSSGIQPCSSKRRKRRGPLHREATEGLSSAETRRSRTVRIIRTTLKKS